MIKTADAVTQETTSKSNEFEELFSLMQGSFDSEKQSIEDTTYYNISLHMYPIWEERGNYLYVEQALSKMQDRPCRQRVYKVEELKDGSFSSAIYKIENDSLWIGKWKTPKAFDILKEDDLILRKGCEVILKKEGDKYYRGATGVKTCESKMRGSTYATSEVEIFKGKIISWNRGFDDKGEHKWSAEFAGYVFDKLK